MNIEITERQAVILKFLLLNGSAEFQNRLGELGNGRLSMANIEELCTLINDEFMTEGILPSFEPNAYGLELEALLDAVNIARIRF